MLNKIIEYIHRDEWSPYIAGILLGVVGIAAVGISNNLLGASGAFESLIGIIGKAIAPSIFSNTYFNYVVPSEITWAVVLLIGIFFGGGLGALTSNTWKLRVQDDEQWKAIFGPQLWKRWLILFIGGIILEYGAGIAGGCTSGLAISGGMLLAPSAFLFIGSMFVSGIITALIIYRGRY